MIILPLLEDIYLIVLKQFLLAIDTAKQYVCHIHGDLYGLLTNTIGMFFIVIVDSV